MYEDEHIEERFTTKDNRELIRKAIKQLKDNFNIRNLEINYITSIKYFQYFGDDVDITGISKFNAGFFDVYMLFLKNNRTFSSSQVMWETEKAPKRYLKDLWNFLEKEYKKAMENSKRITPEDPYGEEVWIGEKLITKFKIFEAYYADLSPYEYGFVVPECVNIGWLDRRHDFEKGDVPEGFIEKLKKLPTFTAHAGYHNCHFCKGGGRDTWSSSIKMVIGNGVVYLTPDMIVHYVRDHHYKPPQEFINAVMDMSEMSDREAHEYINEIMLRHRDHFDKIFRRK